jgi:hypothetical protein
VRLLVAVFAIALFLVAAKTHGRQLRLEREKAGYHSVNFGGENPPFVESLWNAERWRFWPLTIALALIGALVFRGEARFIAMLSWAPSLSFFVTGLLSARRAELFGANWTWYLLTAAIALGEMGLQLVKITAK